MKDLNNTNDTKIYKKEVRFKNMALNESIGLGFVGLASLGSLGYLKFNPEIVTQVLLFSFIILVLYWIIYKSLERNGLESYVVTIIGAITILIGFGYLFKGSAYFLVIGYLYIVGSIIMLKFHLQNIYNE